MDLSKEEVAKALAARELGYVRRTDGAVSMLVSDCIENKHFDILQALCRMLHEALVRVTEDVLGEFRHPSFGVDAVYRGSSFSAAGIHALRASTYSIINLMPTEGETNGID